MTYSEQDPSTKPEKFLPLPRKRIKVPRRTADDVNMGQVVKRLYDMQSELNLTKQQMVAAVTRWQQVMQLAIELDA